VTIPVDVLRGAGLRAGDELTVRADGAGRITFYRSEDLIAKWAGSMADVYHPGYLDQLRNEWRP
jgi:bifunctional DNA-binding transcriptional regulator/antitoxin component of YhaV-PrlF toxin-antitoxin module